MSKWTNNHSDTGILRKCEPREKKEDLLVFGYTCKLFRDDEKALYIDQGKNLIPWMGDETLKIDRYDARGALHDLSPYEAPPGGYDWRMELTRMETDVEHMCDEERYRAMHTDEDEEEMYREEELKRLHAAGYGQVGFNYDTTPEKSSEVVTMENDEPFVPTLEFQSLFPSETIWPDSQKLNAIIEKTAKFIASQGVQMEILLRAKQADNPQFKFLNKDDQLHPYYDALINLVKSGKWPPKAKEEIVEEKATLEEDYLHPSLGATVIESAPSIPSIQYKPSADCAYTMLVSKMKGELGHDEPAYTETLTPGEVAPPGTIPTKLPQAPAHEISKAPVMYNNQAATNQQETQDYYQQYAAYYYQYMNQGYVPPSQPTQANVAKSAPKCTGTGHSTGLSLMQNYDSDSERESETESTEKNETIVIPSEDIKLVIDKMAAYVARNGDEFAAIVRSKNDPRFTFLEPYHMYHGYYMKLIHTKREEMRSGDDEAHKNDSKATAPVSFSIKKAKEPDPVLPKPALPYESSSDDEDDNKQNEDKAGQTQENVNRNSHLPQVIPPIVMYKVEEQPIQVAFNQAPTPTAQIEKAPPTTVQPKENIPIEEKVMEIEKPADKIESNKSPEPQKEECKNDKEEYDNSKRERRKHKDEKSISRSTSRERRSTGEERRSDRKKEKTDRQRRKRRRDEPADEVIALENDNDDDDDIVGDLIDLTGEQSDTRPEPIPEEGRAKQIERRQRAAEFLKNIGVNPVAASLPKTTLASAMVETLEKKQKREEEEKKRRRRREKRDRNRVDEYDGEGVHRKGKKHHRSLPDRHDLEIGDYDSSKRKRHKKDKHHSTKSKKKKRESEPKQLTINLTSTLKELRSSSPTRDLLPDLESNAKPSEEDKEEVHRKKKKGKRVYSEGEWSSDSTEDSKSGESKIKTQQGSKICII